jgi:hypothetical protein
MHSPLDAAKKNQIGESAELLDGLDLVQNPQWVNYIQAVFLCLYG